MNKIPLRAKTLTLCGQLFLWFLFLGASHRPLKPDMAGERLREELQFLEEEKISEKSPPSKAQNIALKEGEIQGESFTLHKKKAEGIKRPQRWLRAR